MILINYFCQTVVKDNSNSASFCMILFTFSGSRSGKLIVELHSQVVGLERIGKTIIVGCMDQTLTCYSTKV